MKSSNLAASYLLPFMLVLALGMAQLAHGYRLDPCYAKVRSALNAVAVLAKVNFDLTIYLHPDLVTKWLIK